MVHPSFPTPVLDNDPSFIPFILSGQSRLEVRALARQSSGFEAEDPLKGRLPIFPEFEDSADCLVT